MTDGPAQTLASETASLVHSQVLKLGRLWIEVSWQPGLVEAQRDVPSQADRDQLLGAAIDKARKR